MPTATRRSFILGSGSLIATLALLRADSAFTEMDPTFSYWSFIDKVQDVMDDRWSESGGHYTPAKGMINSNMLLTHASAALLGHDGPSRRDDRARSIVQQLCTEAWTETGTSSSQGHAPGWRDSLTGGGIQHLVVDTEIAWGLMVAWQARDVLGLDADLIANRIIRAADGKFWRWPTLRLNQINWYTRMYVAASTVGGDKAALQTELLEQIRRFVDGATTKPMAGEAVANLGPGYRFHYLPQEPDHHKYNVDSAEYASTVCGFLVAYQQARQAGMPALDRARAAVVQAWAERVLAGYWTHSGYMNWDTGLSFKRWHQGKKFGLAQAALLGIAVCPELRPSEVHGAWAKHILEQGFGLFGSWIDRDRGLPPANAFDVPSIDDDVDSAALAAARLQANAAQALLLELDQAPSEEPPPLYAYDPDVGRVAVSTPTYNTAIFPVTRGAFPYGGIEPARLFDANQDVAGSIGGRPPASFGVVVRSGGKIVLASQRALQTSTLRLFEAPRGAGSNPESFPRKPYAGAFQRLGARGHVTGDGVTITSTHNFRADYIESDWTVAGLGSRTMEVLFPSWGSGATVYLNSASGGRRRVRGSVGFAPGDWFHVQSQYTGYVVVPLREKGKASLTHVSSQSSDPRPGPTLTVRPSDATFAARYAPARDATEARSVASRLIG
jgi:hypothetical protein